MPEETSSFNPQKDQFLKFSSEFFRRTPTYNLELNQLAPEQVDLLETKFVGQLEQQLSFCDVTPDYQKMSERLNKVIELRRKLTSLPSGDINLTDNSRNYTRAATIIEDSFQKADGTFDVVAYGTWVFVDSYFQIGKRKVTDFSELDTLVGMCYLMDRIHPELIQSGYLDRMKSLHDSLAEDPRLQTFAKTLFGQATAFYNLERENKEYPPKSLVGSRSEDIEGFVGQYQNEREVRRIQAEGPELGVLRAEAQKIIEMFGVPSLIVTGDTAEIMRAKLSQMKTQAVAAATGVVDFDKFSTTQVNTELPLETRFTNASTSIKAVIKQYGDKLPKYDTSTPGRKILSALERIKRVKEKKIL